LITAAAIAVPAAALAHAFEHPASKDTSQQSSYGQPAFAG